MLTNCNKTQHHDYQNHIFQPTAGLSCEKEKSYPVEEIDPNAALDAQVADITGVYHGTIRHKLSDTIN